MHERPDLVRLRITIRQPRPGFYHRICEVLEPVHAHVSRTVQFQEPVIQIAERIGEWRPFKLVNRSLVPPIGRRLQVLTYRVSFLVQLPESRLMRNIIGQVG